MATTNDFVTHVLKLADPERAILWIGGYPTPASGTGTAPEAAVLRLPLYPFAIGPSGAIDRRTDLESRTATMVVRRYGERITRVSVSLDETTEATTSPMLCIDDALDRVGLDCESPRATAAPAGTDCVAPPLEVVVRGDERRVASFRRTLPPAHTWSDLLPEPLPFLDGLFDLGLSDPVRLYGDDQFTPMMRDSLGLAFVELDGRIIRGTCAFHADPGEAFAGTGERFLELDLSGRTIDLINQDALGVNTPRSYKNVPFYLSSRGYGVFVHTSAPMTISFKGVSTRAVSLSTDEDRLDLFLIGGRTPEAVLRGYRQITGFPPELPLWSYGTWMSRMTYFSAEEVDQIADRLRAEHYPCDVIHIDTGWFEKDWVCEWRFSKERFPDPEGFMHRLRERGFRVSLWQNPNLGADNRLIPEAVAKGYIPRPPVAAGASESDFAAASLTGQIDFTNPEAVAWYQSLLRDLFRQGAAVIKTDFGEEIRDDVVYHAMDARKLRNLYGLLYQRAAFEETDRSTGEPIIWARAGWAGAQRYPLHWGGDAAATWDGLAGSIRGGLHLGVSGFGYWSHDVPGFHGVPDFMNTRPDSELYLRWTQFGVLSSHLRYHGTHPREPWFYPDVAPLVREWLKLRYAIIPYILREAATMTSTGMPLMRALFFHHPDDPWCRRIDDEYFLGGDLLVAPFTSSGGWRPVYLPEGTWVDLFTGDRFLGPTMLSERRWSAGHFPVYAREGARIPVYPEEVACTDEMDLDKVVDVVIDDAYRGIAATVLGSYISLDS